MSDTMYIDPLELPFTREEVSEVLRLWTNDEEAVEIIDQCAETAQIDIPKPSGAQRERLLMVGADCSSDQGMWFPDVHADIAAGLQRRVNCPAVARRS